MFLHYTTGTACDSFLSLPSTFLPGALLFLNKYLGGLHGTGIALPHGNLIHVRKLMHHRYSLIIVLASLGACNHRPVDLSDGGPPADLGPVYSDGTTGQQQGTGDVKVFTDRLAYGATDKIRVTLDNGLGSAIFVTGCTPYEVERLEGGKWMGHGGIVDCKWEGYARQIAAATAEKADLHLGQGGTWRVVVRYGVGCLTGQPLSTAKCTGKAVVRSRPFSRDETAQACQFLLKQHQAALVTAKKCDHLINTPQCRRKVTRWLGCGCATYVNNPDEVNKIEQQFKDRRCDKGGGLGCPPSPCPSVKGGACTKGNTCMDVNF